jgi:outer membrane protein assembly factor BamB
MNIYAIFKLLLLPSIATCQFLSTPILRSNRTLPGISSFRQGNGFVEAKNSNHVVMTTSDGRLYIVALNRLVSTNGTLTDDDLLVHTPTTETTKQGIVCSSSPVLVETNLTSFAIYSVIERQSTSEYQSRVMAIKLEDASMLWSVTIPGKVTGNPLVSTNFRHVYIIHNVYDSSQREDDGRISVITIESSRQASISVTFPSEPLGAPFAPGALQAYSRQSTEASTEMIDFIFFGQRIQNGYSRRGSLYSLVVRGEINETLPAQLLLVSDFPGSGIAPPVISNSLDVYLGTEQSYLLGYADGSDFSALVQQSVSVNADDDTGANNDPTNIISYRNANQIPRWVVPLEQNATDTSAPIPGTPILSPDGRYIYVAAAGDEFVCIDRTQAENSGVAWSYATQGVHVATPVYQVLPNRSDAAIYITERDTGVVRQLDSSQGSLRWETNVSTPVEADATLLRNGSLLIYGDVSGRVVVLLVTEGVIPIDDVDKTSPPSKAPRRSKSSSPTVRKGVSEITPSKQVPSYNTGSGNETSMGPNQQISNTTESSTSSTSSEQKSTSFKSVVVKYLPYVLGGGCGIILFLILIILCVTRRQKKKRHVTVLADLDKQREEEDSARIFEQTRLKIEKECEEEEQETLDAIISSPSPNRRSIDNNTLDTSMNSSNETCTLKVSARRDPNEIASVYSSAQVGFEISQDDYSVSESSNDLSSAPMGFSPTLSSPKQKAIPQLILQIDPLPPSAVSCQLSIGSLSPKRGIVPDGSLQVPSLLPPLISAAPSQDEIDTLAHSVSSARSHNSGEKIDKTESLISKVAAVLSMSSTGPGPQEVSLQVNKKKEPLDGGDEDDGSEMEGFSNFMGEFVTPQPSLHQRPLTQQPAANVASPIPDENTIKKEARKVAIASLKNRVGSSTFDDTNSVDDSLYMDESAIEVPIYEADIGAGSSVFDGFHKSEQKQFDSIEDEPPAILKPGSRYHERHTTEKGGHTTDSTSAEIRRYLDRNMLKPTYKGVSARPSRAKAGLFSRRIGSTGRPSDSDEDIAVGSSYLQPPQINTAQIDPLPTKRKKELLVVEQRVEPSPASYYVEETELTIGQNDGRDEKKTDSKTEWNSFLQELSDAEDKFFNPLSPSRNHDNVEIQQPVRPSRFSNRNGRRSRRIGNMTRDDESDTSSEHDAPPPPRTFYA